MTALVGPSGSGKSTIIKLMPGEVVPTAGRVMVNGFSMSRISERQIPYMRRTIGVIFQDFRLIANKTVYDNLALAMRAVDASPRALRERIPYVLELAGLADKENRYPDELSGGELVCACEASPHNLVDILDTLRAADVALGRVWSEPPTLNDVFLEITGRELRD